MNRFTRSLWWLSLAFFLEAMLVFAYVTYWTRLEDGMWSAEHIQMKALVGKMAPSLIYSSFFLLSLGAALLVAGLVNQVFRSRSH